MMCSCSITGSTADLKGIMRSSFADGSFHLAVAVHQSFFFRYGSKIFTTQLRAGSLALKSEWNAQRRNFAP